jgi:hypothetical protein
MVLAIFEQHKYSTCQTVRTSLTNSAAIYRANMHKYENIAST